MIRLRLPKALPAGPGLLLSTGGSSGSRQLCLQPSIHLDRSAAATGRWLHALGLNASQVIVWNPLPFQHVSGLMPWWRAQQWNVAHVWLSPALMKSPQALLAESCQRSDWDSMPMVLSLVPTQLGRLLADSCRCALVASDGADLGGWSSVARRACGEGPRFGDQVGALLWVHRDGRDGGRSNSRALSGWRGRSG